MATKCKITALRYTASKLRNLELTLCNISASSLNAIFQATVALENLYLSSVEVTELQEFQISLKSLKSCVIKNEGSCSHDSQMFAKNLIKILPNNLQLLEMQIGRFEIQIEHFTELRSLTFDYLPQVSVY
jgi:hypothetical protein